MFSLTQLQDVEDDQLDLYMDWLLEEISRCESEADSNLYETSNEIFHSIKLRMMQQELECHSRELQHVLDEKKRRLFFWCY